ncbi:amidotransferase [Enterococcus florum]|uniref:Amidotransferase n=1 Tax=Enterococcus florum TaxID=2480627 RepID=A0A4P5PF33_9ENTE|nr:gamma-glutamyl-gamma-aminobutyrate hydrolase family protein [Enterococcus florum]GCF95334.1 amidotransferase [Enterococcus florum]
MKKPVIGIMPLYDREKESLWMLPGYPALIEENGGIPLLLPLTDNLKTLDYFLETCDGFLFTGGHDVTPALYNQEPSSRCGETNRLRDTMDCYCMEKAIELDKPLLGICRGAQLLNVIAGGTLYQDLPTEKPSQLNHQMQAPYDRQQHDVQLIEGTLLAELFGKTTLGVNSYHHQGIKEIGSQLTVTALAEDGLVEAIYLPDRTFALAVQWHPEFFAPDTKENQLLLQAFLSHCFEAEKQATSD